MRANHRIVRQILPSGATYDGVYEVYYNEDGTPCSRAQQLSTILAPDARSLAVVMSDLRKSFDLPILLEVNDSRGRFVEIPAEKGDLT